VGYLETTVLTEATERFDPDVHAQAGMTCTDCHVGGELHGSETLHASRYTSPSLRCADCHGTVDRRVTRGRDGGFAAAAGWPLSTLHESPAGEPVVLTAAGGSLTVPQLADFEESRAAHGPDHARVACAACHSTFTIACVGCHVTVDESASPTASLIDESWTLGGSIREQGLSVNTSTFQLGEAPDGTVYPVVAQAILLSRIDARGTLVRDREILRRGAAPAVALAAIEPHTVGRARACSACHIEPDGSNAQAVRRLIGAAPSEAIVEDGAGVRWDIGHLLDDDYAPTTSFPSGAARPLSAARARKLLEEPVR